MPSIERMNKVSTVSFLERGTIGLRRCRAARWTPLCPMAVRCRLPFTLYAPAIAAATRAVQCSLPLKPRGNLKIKRRGRRADGGFFGREC